MTVQQSAVDYTNDAQIRTAVDLRCLQRTGTLIIPPGETVRLPVSVIELRGVSDGVSALPRLREGDALAALSSAAMMPLRRSWYVIGRQLGILPSETSFLTLTLFYDARPATFTDQSSIELSDIEERYMERILFSDQLDDDGQPELAQAELQVAQQLRLRRKRRYGSNLKMNHV